MDDLKQNNNRLGQIEGDRALMIAPARC
ncbi:hypothetical protein DFAR_1980004 [Desulfarculales bacterium]